MHERRLATKTIAAVYAVLTVLALAVSGEARADLQVRAYRAMGLEVGDVLTGTVIPRKVIPGDDTQVVALATFLTGKRDRADAVSVRLEVFREGPQGELVSLYNRDFGEENEGFIGEGNLQLVDLDRDGVSEILVTYDDLESPLIRYRAGEVILHEASEFRTAWSGPMLYDATRAARQVPAERRDRFERELDIANTLRTRGVTLFFQKKVIAVAGARLPEARIVQETFPLRTPPDRP